MLNVWFKIADLPKSSFYEWKNKLNQINQEEKVLTKEIKSIISESNNSYGYRRVTLALKNQGKNINHKKVLRIMRENNLLCIRFTRRSRKYSSFKGEVGKIADNKLNREFTVDKQNQVWVSDVTEFKIKNSETRLYLSPIMDLFNSEILSYTISTSPTVAFVRKSLDEALKKLPKNHDLMIHTDQGFHYQNFSWIETLNKYNIIQSMSRRGNCLDNSPMENFFGLLKQEIYYGETFNSYDELKKAIEDYIYWYNNKRIKIKLNGLSPIEFRQQAA